jgi:hypothetical protein
MWVCNHLWLGKLKFKLKSREEVPAGQESHYVERDGVWILDADGAADKTKLDEFRSTNVALLKEWDDWLGVQASACTL